MALLKDSDPMPFKGKFHGEKMEDVPYWYLFWLEDQKYCPDDVKLYI